MRFTSLVAIWVVAGTAHAGVVYTVTDLGPGAALGVNDAGDVVGRSDGRAVLWQGAGWNELETPTDRWSGALDINNAGQGVGTWVADAFPYQRRGALWSDGVLTDLGDLGGGHASAFSINEVGDVVGWSSLASGDYHAFLWRDGEMRDLGTLPDTRHCSAEAINDAGQAVGHSVPDRGFIRAVTWQDDEITELETPGQHASIANDINASGQIVGYVAAGGFPERAVLWDAGTLSELDSAFPGGRSAATAINTIGQVVGWTSTPDRRLHAVMWEEGILTDLNDLLPGESDWVLLEAHDINDAGDIVGLGRRDHEYRAFRMSPIPDPATHVLLLIAGSSILRRPRSIKTADVSLPCVA